MLTRPRYRTLLGGYTFVKGVGATRQEALDSLRKKVYEFYEKEKKPEIVRMSFPRPEESNGE